LKNQIIKNDKKYWDHLYAEPLTMDGIGNAKEHSTYLKALFEIEKIQITSIIDYGFGLGHLFQRFLREFLPYKAVGVEPSNYAFKKATKRKLQIVESMELNLYNAGLIDYFSNTKSEFDNFDLGICTSVFQYIPNKDLEILISSISKQCKYLYLTVPTDIELDEQEENLDFIDEYALKRSQKYYQTKFKKYFTFISSRLLESKYFVHDQVESEFSDLLFRF
jgi:hypothetical protein